MYICIYVYMYICIYISFISIYYELVFAFYTASLHIYIYTYIHIYYIYYIYYRRSCDFFSTDITSVIDVASEQRCVVVVADGFVIVLGLQMFTKLLSVEKKSQDLRLSSEIHASCRRTL